MKALLAVSAVLAVASAANAQSVTTLFASNNGGSVGGAVYFDVSVGPNALTITGYDTNVGELVPFGWEVYLTAPGVSYLGNEANPGAWSLVATGNGVGMGDDVPSPVTLDATFDLAANTLYGMALVLGPEAGHEYTNGPLGPYGNADLTLDLGSATNVPFSGSPFHPRVWNGTIYYEGGGGGGCPEATMNVVIFTDNYPGETTWEIYEHGVGVIASGGPYADPATLYEEEVCVNYNSCFDFTIYDAWGDGICCAYGNGYYEVYYEGALVASGGEFGSSETTFDIGDNCVPIVGACCVGGDCVATNTQPECDALGGQWFEGEDCATFMCPAPPECPAYHCSARVMPPAGGRENTVFVYDVTGTLVYAYPEFAGAFTDSWGYRDGCTDRDGHIFFGWGGGLNQHDSDGGNPVQIFPDGGPNGTWRALAFDTTGDGGAGSIWSASFGSDLVEAALDGTILNTYPVDGWSLYGLAYDDADGNIWGHSSGGDIIKIDTTTGTVIPGEGWPTGFANLSSQGGLSGLHDNTGYMAAISQGTPDELGIYDLTGTLVGGPYDIEAQSGSNGHLGVAVCLGEGGLVGYFDIKPGSCPNPFNTKAEGKFPCALLGSMDLDVMLVNPASLQLWRSDGIGGSVAPVRFNYEDVGTPFMGDLCDCHALEGDGLMDMTVKFLRREMTDVMMLEGMTGDVPLTLSGELLDGTPFTAADCITMVPTVEEEPEGTEGK